MYGCPESSDYPAVERSVDAMCVDILRRAEVEQFCPGAQCGDPRIVRPQLCLHT